MRRFSRNSKGDTARSIGVERLFALHKKQIRPKRF